MRDPAVKKRLTFVSFMAFEKNIHNSTCIIFSIGTYIYSRYQWRIQN